MSLTEAQQKIFTVLLALTVSALLLLPSLSKKLPSAGDVIYYLDMIGSARDALREGQFPPREVPKVMDGMDPIFGLSPLFQFMGGLHYVAGAALALLGLPLYTAMLTVLFLCMLAGFAGVFQAALLLGCSRMSAALAALAYLMAPVQLFVWNSGSSFSQACATGLLALAFARALASALDPTLFKTCLSSLAWIALILTHSIFHAWSVPLFGLFLLLLRWQRPELRLVPPFMAYLLAAACCLWILWPLALMAGSFNFYNFFSVFETRHSTTPALMLSPWGRAVTDPFSHTPEGAQLGIFLTAAVAGLVAWGRRRGLPLLAVFGLVFFLAWSPLPFDFWRYLGPLQNLQQTYRLVIYLSFFGSLAVAMVWDFLPGPWRLRLAAPLAMLMFMHHMPYLERHPTPFDSSEQESFFDTHGFSGGYHLVIREPVPANVAALSPEIRAPQRGGHFRIASGLEVIGGKAAPGLEAYEPGLWTRVRLNSMAAGSILLLPEPWYPGMFECRVNGMAMQPGRLKNRLAVLCLNPGKFSVEYRFRGSPLANGLSAFFWLVLAVLTLFSWRRQRPAISPFKIAL